MITLLKQIRISQDGASAAEYALMIALVGGLIIVAATSLSTGISTVFTSMATATKAAARNMQNP